MLLEGIIDGLWVAFILTAFDVNELVIEAFQPMVEFTLTDSHYYIGFAILGIISV